MAGVSGRVTRKGVVRKGFLEEGTVGLILEGSVGVCQISGVSGYQRQSRGREMGITSPLKWCARCLRGRRKPGGSDSAYSSEGILRICASPYRQQGPDEGF